MKKIYWLYIYREDFRNNFINYKRAVLFSLGQTQNKEKHMLNDVEIKDGIIYIFEIPKSQFIPLFQKSSLYHILS